MKRPFALSTIHLLRHVAPSSSLTTSIIPITTIPTHPLSRLCAIAVPIWQRLACRILAQPVPFHARSLAASAVHGGDKEFPGHPSSAIQHGRPSSRASLYPIYNAPPQTKRRTEQLTRVSPAFQCLLGTLMGCCRAP
ncbi:hypothetical protein M432DRAFT_281493 [Thermoascus aurantiacus ATCC 26904]